MVAQQRELSVAGIRERTHTGDRDLAGASGRSVEEHDAGRGRKREHGPRGDHMSARGRGYALDVHAPAPAHARAP